MIPNRQIKKTNQFFDDAPTPSINSMASEAGSDSDEDYDEDRDL